MNAAARSAGLAAYAAALATIVAGCGGDGAPGSVDIALAPGALLGPQADPGTPVVDGAGYASLDLFPFCVRARVEADDLEEPVEDTWPEVVPTSTPEVVQLELVVPAGAGRRIAIDVLAADDAGLVTTYVSPGPDDVPITVDVVSGATTDVDVELAELPRGTVRATVGAGIDGLAWVDAAARVVLPAAEPASGVVESTLTVGRAYWPRVVTTSGETLDIDEHVVELTSEDEILETAVDISE